VSPEEGRERTAGHSFTPAAAPGCSAGLPQPPRTPALPSLQAARCLCQRTAATLRIHTSFTRPAGKAGADPPTVSAPQPPEAAYRTRSPWTCHTPRRTQRPGLKAATSAGAANILSLPAVGRRWHGRAPQRPAPQQPPRARRTGPAGAAACAWGLPSQPKTLVIIARVVCMLPPDSRSTLPWARGELHTRRAQPGVAQQRRHPVKLPGRDRLIRSPAASRSPTARTSRGHAWLH